MTKCASRGAICQTRAAVLLFTIALSIGCAGDEGPQKYDVTGAVTYKGKPIPYGDIRFEPTQGLVNRQSVVLAEIRDGQYSARIVGGPHHVSVRDLSGGGDESTARPMFQMEYQTKAELPPLESVQGTHTFDVEVPAKHK